MLFLFHEPTPSVLRNSLTLTGANQDGHHKGVATLLLAMTTYGIPEHIRSDNGTEFIALKIQQLLQENQIKTLYIDPGSP
jgi:putative transposase